MVKFWLEELLFNSLEIVFRIEKTLKDRVFIPIKTIPTPISPPTPNPPEVTTLGVRGKTNKKVLWQLERCSIFRKSEKDKLDSLPLKVFDERRVLRPNTKLSVLIPKFSFLFPFLLYFSISPTLQAFDRPRGVLMQGGRT